VTIFDVPGKRKRIKELEEQMAGQGFWQDGRRAAKVTKEASSHKTVVDRWEAFMKEVKDLGDLLDLAEEAEDTEVGAEITGSLEKISAEIEALELESMLAGPDDVKDAILAIHPGAGGTESQDWAQMLRGGRRGGALRYRCLTFRPATRPA
jgi:peptide chain release factor 2